MTISMDEHVDNLATVLGYHQFRIEHLSQRLSSLEERLHVQRTGTQSILDPQKMIDVPHARELCVQMDLPDNGAVSPKCSSLALTGSSLHSPSLSFDSILRDAHDAIVSGRMSSIGSIDELLRPEDLLALDADTYEAQYRWDKWDVIFVGAAGVLACLTDIFLVAIPKTMTVGKFAGQQGSKITERLQNLRLPDEWQKWLEKRAVVPYDKTGGSLHRIDSLGHDPVLGFIFGVIDIMTGGSTSVKNGVLGFAGGISDPILNPLEAIIRQFLHLVSDVATKRGLPIPFSGLLRCLNFGSICGQDGKERTISELVLWMYHHGYDLRHFVTMAITPATIEIVLRAYIMIRHYWEKGENRFVLGNNPKYRSMLLAAHSIACAGNVGKVAMLQGNPLAINYAEWLMFLRYLLPSLKYWLIDRKKLRREFRENQLSDGWDRLLADCV